MGPVELFVGSVVSCVAYFVGQFCGRHGIARDGLTVDAEWTMAELPHPVRRIEIRIHLPHRISAEQKQRLLKVVRCDRSGGRRSHQGHAGLYQSRGRARSKRDVLIEGALKEAMHGS